MLNVSNLMGQNRVRLLGRQDFEQSESDYNSGIALHAAERKGVGCATLNDSDSRYLQTSFGAEALDELPVHLRQPPAMVIPANVQQAFNQVWAEEILYSYKDHGKCQGDPQGST